MSKIWDCIVVGGGAAGLSAGLVLGRARRNTLLIDAGQQSNLPAHGIGGLLGHDGRAPAELYALGRKELESYGVQIRSGDVVDVEGVDGDFTVRLGDGAGERSRCVLLATGMAYLPPDIPGIAPLWGRSVFHCPFCHGWEVRDLPLAVLADGDRATHLALLLRCWSDDIVLLTGGPSSLGAADRARLGGAGIRVDERPVAALDAHDGELSAIVFADAARLPRRGLLVAANLRQRDQLAERLGVAVAAPGPAAQDPVGVDSLCRTSIPGVFAAGDVTGEMPQVAAAIAAGSRAAAAVVQSLAAGPMADALPDPREFWDGFYGGDEHVWSGRVNVRLAEVTADLAPGRALDLGCGEGADAIWLAEDGWQVVAVDVSANALERACTAAQERGVTSHIRFERHDLSTSFPAGRFDLVTAQFLHSPVSLDREAVLRRAADAVAVDGWLLIVDHGAAPPWAGEHVHEHHFATADEVLAGLCLEDGKWERVRVGAVERDAVGPDGQTAMLTDNIILLRRTGSVFQAAS